MEDQRSLVERRLLQEVLVPVVEPDCLVREHNQRKQERCRGQQAPTPDYRDRNDKGDARGKYVDERKGAAEDRVAAEHDGVADALRQHALTAENLPRIRRRLHSSAGAAAPLEAGPVSH
ncbi:MAG: hypothetical protein NVS2B6_12610 [Thermoleophilaceae bacterium]